MCFLFYRDIFQSAYITESISIINLFIIDIWVDDRSCMVFYKFLSVLEESETYPNQITNCFP